MRDWLIYEGDCRAGHSAGPMIRRWVELDDEEGKIFAIETLQPGTVHGNGHIAIVVQSFGQRRSYCTAAGGVGVIQLDCDGGVDGIIVWIPRHCTKYEMSADSSSSLKASPTVVCLANPDVTTIRRLTEGSERPASIVTYGK